MARRLGFSCSCTASINMVSVFREPAEPPKSRMSASESSAAFCAAVAGIQRELVSSGSSYCPRNEGGCPISRSFFARSGIPRNLTIHPRLSNASRAERLFHISRKKREPIGTRLSSGLRTPASSRLGKSRARRLALRVFGFSATASCSHKESSALSCPAIFPLVCSGFRLASSQYMFRS